MCQKPSTKAEVINLISNKQADEVIWYQDDPNYNNKDMSILQLTRDECRHDPKVAERGLKIQNTDSV